MSYLNKKDHRGHPDKELITDPRDPTDDRRKVLKLTGLSRRLVAQIAHTIGS